VGRHLAGYSMAPGVFSKAMSRADSSRPHMCVAWSDDDVVPTRMPGASLAYHQEITLW